MKELPGYIQHFDVCINPQKLNPITIGNYPLKVDEYLAMGKPVVATRVTGTADYVRDGENGLLVPPGDVSALVQAVQQLLRDPAQANRLSGQALLDCRNQWSPDRHAAHKIEAILSLWKNSAKPAGTPASSAIRTSAAGRGPNKVACSCASSATTSCSSFS